MFDDFIEEDNVGGYFADVMERMAAAQSLDKTLRDSEQREKAAYLKIAEPIWTFPKESYFTFTDMLECYRDVDLTFLCLSTPLLSGHVVSLWGKKFWLNTPAQLMLAVHQGIHGKDE